MDIRCRKCGEPWDIDTLHEVAAENESTFDEVRQDFYNRGCGALWGPADCGSGDAETGALVDMVHELMGDDIDGVASMLEDAEYLGLI